MKSLPYKIALAVILIAAITARPYHGAAAGVAWDFGGIEFSPAPAVFVCAGTLYGDTFIANPIAPLFPDLLTDC